MRYPLNFAFLAFFISFELMSPERSFSAPTFLPLLGQPYLGPNTLFHKLHEDNIKLRATRINMERKFFIFYCSTNETTHYKLRPV